MSDQWSEQRLHEVTSSFQECRILLTAAQLDLFTKLEERPQTADELCSQQGWSLRGLTILMDALAAQGILDRSSDGHYSVNSSIKGLLVKGGKDSILPMVLHRGTMWETWSHLTEIVTTGTNSNRKDILSRPGEDMEAFIGAMHFIGLKMAKKIATSVDLKLFTRMLDVGGASGTYTMAFLAKAPHMTATVFDLPGVVEMARKRIAEYGLSDRVQVVAGDYTTDELPQGHDLVLLSAVIHSNGRDVNQKLYAKIHQALAPVGSVLIRDYFLDSTRTSPPDGAMFAVNMLAATTAGTAYTFEEVRDDLANAGFKDIRMIRDGDHMNQLVIAAK
ncbi:MAG: methyltransferase [Desulfomonilaceae bacterium]